LKPWRIGTNHSLKEKRQAVYKQKTKTLTACRFSKEWFLRDKILHGRHVSWEPTLGTDRDPYRAPKIREGKVLRVLPSGRWLPPNKRVLSTPGFPFFLFSLFSESLGDVGPMKKTWKERKERKPGNVVSCLSEIASNKKKKQKKQFQEKDNRRPDSFLFLFSSFFVLMKKIKGKEKESVGLFFSNAGLFFVFWRDNGSTFSQEEESRRKEETSVSNFQKMKRKNQEEVENTGRTTSTSISWFFYSSGSCIEKTLRFLEESLTAVNQRHSSKNRREIKEMCDSTNRSLANEHFSLLFLFTSSSVFLFFIFCLFRRFSKKNLEDEERR
jgi:hypothetical protein